MSTYPTVRSAAPLRQPVVQRSPVQPARQPAPVPTKLNPQPFTPEPIFDTKRAAVILSRSFETLKKWRQRDMGPEYVRYEDSAIRYRLSALMKYIEDHTVRPSKS